MRPLPILSRRLSGLVFLLLAQANLSASEAEPATKAAKTVWSGVYSQKQAARGASAYAESCSRCHREDLSGYSGLRGEKFFDNWREDSLSSLWQRLAKTMPAGAPGSLPESEYLDILAYILKENEFPAGAQDLVAEQIPEIRVEAKTGPAPVPDFALVQTVGCLAKSPDGTWLVRRASDPVRTRNPGNSPAAELKTAARSPEGSNSFRILDGSGLKPELHEGRKASVKGFLIRKTNDDRLNTTSIEVVEQACP